MVVSHGVTLESSVFYSEAEVVFKKAREATIYRLNHRLGTMIPIQSKTIQYHQKGEGRLPEIVTKEVQLWAK